ncbi:hypothetical protein DEA98_10055 [Brucella pseudogrignonensis]|nr:hypothetical protein [Brucella pseudogrignonensis]
MTYGRGILCCLLVLDDAARIAPRIELKTERPRRELPVRSDAGEEPSDARGLFFRLVRAEDGADFCHGISLE